MASIIRLQELNKIIKIHVQNYFKTGLSEAQLMHMPP